MTFVFRRGLRFCACGFDISNHRETATKCFSCRRKASPMKTCVDCGCQFQELNARRCDRCSRANYVYRRYASGQTLAISAVAVARKKGELQPPTDFDCADCGVRATEYDHRDYDKPLTVEPVCRRCNRRRGYAKRKSWSFDEFWVWFQKILSDHKEHYGGYVSQLQLADFDHLRQRHWREPRPIHATPADTQTQRFPHERQQCFGYCGD